MEITHILHATLLLFRHIKMIFSFITIIIIAMCLLHVSVGFINTLIKNHIYYQITYLLKIFDSSILIYFVSFVIPHILFYAFKNTILKRRSAFARLLRKPVGLSVLGKWTAGRPCCRSYHRPVKTRLTTKSVRMPLPSTECSVGTSTEVRLGQPRAVLQ